MNALQKKSDAVRELTMFALRRKGACFPGWKPEIVFRYIAFHLLAGTLFIVREGRAILGIGISYSCDLFYLKEREGLPFTWLLPPPGNVLFIADVIASKRAIPTLLRMGLEKFPWITEVMTYRNGRLEQLHMRHLDRLARMGRGCGV